MARLLLLLAALGALCLPTLALAAQAPPALAGVSAGTLVHDGIERSYLLYTPAQLPPGPVPLVLMLHGRGGTPEIAMNVLAEGRWNELAERDGFIVAYPAGVGGQWNDCRSDVQVDDSTADDVGFLSALIDRLAASHSLDERRIYLAGHSAGGIMAQRVAIELSDRVAAIASTNGPMAAASECPAPRGPIAVAYLAGTDDPVVPFAGGPISGPSGGRGTVRSAAETIAFWRQVNGTGATPTVTGIPDTVAGDNSTVTRYVYGGGARGSEVRYYQVDGGGHAWPGPTQHDSSLVQQYGYKNQDLVFCDEAWAFFQSHALPEPQPSPSPSPSPEPSPEPSPSPSPAPRILVHLPMLVGGG